METTNLSKKNQYKRGIQSGLSQIGKHYTTISAVIVALQVVSIFIPFSFTAISALAITGTTCYIAVKETLDDKTKKTGMLLLKASILFMLLGFINGMISPLNASFIASSGKSLKLFQVFLTIGLSLGYFAFILGDKGKELCTKIEAFSLLDFSSDEKKEGDIVLGKNKDSNKPILLRKNDRFVHTLVLGPTGCGKTSQILTPMIAQDMKDLSCGITLIEPKGDFAEKVDALAKYHNRKVLYFNPTFPDCPYFNPLCGSEDDVIENMATTFKMLNPDSPQFFQDMNENLVRNALKVLKRLKGDNATLIDLSTLVHNAQGNGKKMITMFSRLKAETEEIAKENKDIASWFLSDYYAEKSKTYEHCSSLRSQVSKITSNNHLRRVLNPPDGKNDIDFQKHLEGNGVLAITTAQGELRDLGRFLGYFIILCLQSAVFKRPGTSDTRSAQYLYIDEFQVYSNPGFADMLTQGRSYRVASTLATQNRALMAMGGGRDGKNFVELVSTNARNVIIFPGANSIDAKYYSDEFGEVTRKQLQKGISRKKFNPLLYGMDGGGAPTEQIRHTEVVEARYSASDIIYRPFKEITYRLIEKDSVGEPGVGIIDFIPREMNEQLDSMVAEYRIQQEDKAIALGFYPAPSSRYPEEDDIPNVIIGKDIYQSAQNNKEIIDRKVEYVEDVVITSEEIKQGQAPIDFDIDDPENDDCI